MSRNSSASEASNDGPASRSQLFKASFVWRIAGCAPAARRHRDRERALLELIRRNAQRHEADPLRLETVERLAQQEVVLRLRHPAQERPDDHRVVAGGDAELCVPVDDPRLRGGDRDVGQEPDREARPDGRAGHRRHDRLRAVDDVVDQVTRLVEDA